MIFNYRKNIIFQEIKIGDGIIQKNDCTIFLGINIYCNLTFSNHLNFICSKISKTIGILYKIRNYMPTNVLISIYQGLILPYLTYGIELWGGAGTSLLNKLVISQKKAIRAINNLPFNGHTAKYFQLNTMLPIILSSCG
jgi:hypothetical protein